MNDILSVLQDILSELRDINRKMDDLRGSDTYNLDDIYGALDDLKGSGNSITNICDKLDSVEMAIQMHF